MNAAAHINEVYSKNGKIWNLKMDGWWVGGHLPAPNLSQGYHAIQQQWWEEYATGNNVLLVSETKKVKRTFESIYKHWSILAIDRFTELTDASSDGCDIVGDICEVPSPLAGYKFDLIINQATLEHVYNPFGAMKNLVDSLNRGGIIISHTHPPAMVYHSFPRDYFRFMKDWWYDLPQWLPGIELLELAMIDNLHVFTCFRKI